MINRDTFSAYHPLINFLYFALVLLFSMCFMHPVYLLISLAAGFCYSIYLRGRKAAHFSLVYMLPMMLLVIIINPAFTHEGATILTYLPSGNPLTLESMVYGAASATMLATVLIWFSCFNEVITSDKFVYLFGRIIPSLSLILSMALRFIPKFTAQTKVVTEAQRCVGRDISTGSIFQRLKTAITIFSIMLTWALEDAIETADSMKSRGYGLEGRTAFSIYRFDERDRTAMAWLVFCGFFIICAWSCGGMYFRYYPTVKGTGFDPLKISVAVVYMALCFTPLILNAEEDRKWKHLR